MIQDSPHDHLVLIGHSLGCETIAQAAGEVKRVDLLVLIEPAPDDIRLPKNVGLCLWYQRTNFDFFIRMAKVFGPSPIKINGGHNDVPQSKEVVAAVVKAINRIPVRDRKK
jgi:pimeloyl-ACP methyl ester carboxylesterase